jgi:hypothetical protein
MKRRIILILSGVTLLALSITVPIAYAHTGRDGLRTHRQCKNIPKRHHHMREACYECVAKPRHHFHPSYPDGERCVHNRHK